MAPCPSGRGRDFDCFLRRVLALGKESEAHTFDETTGNIMVLCAGATSDSFRRKLRLKGRALTLENIQELADDSHRAEKEEQDMNALRGEQIRVVGKPEPDKGIRKTVAIEVRRLENVLATAAEKTITRRRNAPSHVV